MLTDLRLQNFRSYKDASFEFSPGVNIIVGPNASGKTNLLEAVLIIARGNSYRAKDSELIRFNKPWARLDSHSEISGKRTVKLIAQPETSKTFEIEDKKFKRLSKGRSLPVVLFEPNHLLLLSGSPERRRDYIDDMLEQTILEYSSTRRQYKRALAQRNALLKQAKKPSHIQLFPWNLRLSETAGQIVRARSQLVDKINKEAGLLYKILSNTNTELHLNYNSNWHPDGYQSNLLKKLESNLEIDHLRGFTTTGPHRDDLIVLLNGRLAQESASRGETRTVVLVLKIIELHIVQSAYNNQPPLLLLDRCV